VVIENRDDKHNTLVIFMHPEGQSPSSHWSQKDDKCWVEMERMLKVIQAPAPGQDIGTSSMKRYRT
jgi:hypothetical protein